MKKFRFTSFSFTILIALFFSFVFFSCASKPAPESVDEQTIEAPSENIENVENKTLEENKEENSTENSENDNNEYEIDELDEIEVIDEPIVIDFFPAEDEAENNDSKNVEVKDSDNIILEEIIEDFEELTPIEEIEKTENSVENKDLENSNNSDSQLIHENQKEENNLEATEVNPSTEQESETLTEENIENFPIIEVESEENQQDEISQSELEILYANIVPSRKISIKLGEKILITYPGLNWKFYGITDDSKDVELIERNKIRTNTTFEFITKNSGIKILHFYKFDNVTQNYIDDFIEIEIISENTEDEVLDVSLLEEEKSNVAKTETKTVEAPKYKKVESAKKIGTKKQINEESQKIQETESKETDKIEKEEKVTQNKNKVVKKLEDSKVSNTSDEEIIKNKVQKQVVQKKETVVKKSEEKTVETKTEIEDNSTLEEENEESPSLSKSEIDDLLISAKKLYNEKKYKESLEKVNLFLELSVEKRDEALFLQGQLYESQSNVKNIKKALESYNSIIANYPSSKVWEDANKRIIYLNRFYLKGR